MSVAEGYLRAHKPSGSTITLPNLPAEAVHGSISMTQTSFYEQVSSHLRWASDQFEVLGEYDANWDGYSAAAPNLDIVSNAAIILAVLKTIWSVPAPSVNPTRIGGASMEWEIGTRYLEIDTDTPSSAVYLYKDFQTEERSAGRIDAYGEAEEGFLALMKLMFNV
jgi:hypothetical protein